MKFFARVPWALLLAMGCGGASREAPAGAAEVEAAGGPRAGGGAGFEASQTVGGMDPDRVRSVVSRTVPEVDRCMADGRKRLPFLGGAIALALTVDGTGRASSASIIHSTLGDRRVETCMLEAFSAKQWPRPVGGKVGEIEQRFDFEDPDDGELMRWSADDLARAMAAEEDGQGAFDELVGKLTECQREAGSGALEVTAYLDEDGVVQAVGLASPEGKAADAAECVDTVVRTTSFPAPGGGFVKLTVSVP